jgi:putative DNA primase/helicase
MIEKTDNWELDNLENELDSEIFFVEGKFKAPLLAGNIAYHMFDINGRNQVNRGFLVTNDNKQIWRYDGTRYLPDGEEFIKSLMQKALGIKSNSTYKKEVIEWIKDDKNLQISRSLFNDSLDFINLENGIYDIKANVLNEHSPGYFFTYQIPVNYDPDAKINQIKDFLESTLYADDIPVIQELFGYCFYKQYFLHKAFMFVGEGRNGKSTLINLFTHMLGRDNISNVPLQTLCRDKFSVYDLYGKLANLCSELSSEALKNTGLFKSATGGDYIRAEKKYQDGFSFINDAKFVFSCNILPECNDPSIAYAKRWIVVEFPNTFEGNNCDPNLLEKLTTEEEISGLFNWSIDGLKRLLEIKQFSKHRTFDDVQKFQAEHQDPIFLFIETKIERDIESELTKEEVYNGYLEFCREHDYPKVASNQFSQKFKQLAPWGIDEGQSRKKGRKKTWKGVKFKKQTENEKISICYEKLDQQEELL